MAEQKQQSLKEKLETLNSVLSLWDKRLGDASEYLRLLAVNLFNAEKLSKFLDELKERLSDTKTLNDKVALLRQETIASLLETIQQCHESMTSKAFELDEEFPKKLKELQKGKEQLIKEIKSFQWNRDILIGDTKELQKKVKEFLPEKYQNGIDFDKEIKDLVWQSFEIENKFTNEK